MGGLDGGLRHRAPYGAKKKTEEKRHGEIRSKGMIVEMKVARPTRPIFLKQRPLYRRTKQLVETKWLKALLANLQNTKLGEKNTNMLVHFKE